MSAQNAHRFNLSDRTGCTPASEPALMRDPITCAVLRPVLLSVLLASALPAFAQSANGAPPDEASPEQPAAAAPETEAPAAASDTPAPTNTMGTMHGSPGDDTAITPSTARSGAGPRGGWWASGQGRMSIGLNVGQSDFDLPCVPAFGCDRRDVYAAVSARNMANDVFGGELALVHMGNSERGGGNTSAYGLNLSLVGKTPVMTGLGAFAKIGTVWGETRVGGDSTALATGRNRGFGLSLGAGVSWDFTPNLAAVIEWDRYNFHFVGSGREAVNTASLGLQWKY
jgi:OOP family OmpA-OmpF porin